MTQTLPATHQTEPFQLPPAVTDADGQVRRAGFELEFSGLSIEDAVQIVCEQFGGTAILNNRFSHRVEGTRFGDFSIVVDSTVLKDLTYREPLRALGLDPENMDLRLLESALSGIIQTWIPLEICTPPIAITELSALDELRRRLFEAEAEGTRRRLWYFFGLHINAQTPSMEPRVILNHLRAFLLLYPWLRDRVRVDSARSISGFISPFPAKYARLVLAEDYPVSRERLIDDYLEHNPTRNRPLDLLPLLACLDRQRVIDQTSRGDKSLVKPRPAYHYRLPNCLVDEPDWSIAREWNTWVAVERLAHHPYTIARMSRDYLAADDDSFRPFFDKWPKVLESYVGMME